MDSISSFAFVVISPATTRKFVDTRHSQATLLSRSSLRAASRTASDIWSHTLSGCPSVTDSEVKKCIPLIKSHLYQPRHESIFNLFPLNSLFLENFYIPSLKDNF